MAAVNTVMGPVDTADLGFTLSHEHIMVSAGGMRHTYTGFHDREDTIEDAVVALSYAYDEGLRTITDLTTFDLGCLYSTVGRGTYSRTQVHLVLSRASSVSFRCPPSRIRAQAPSSKPRRESLRIRSPA